MWEIVFCQKEICFWDTWIVSLLGNVWTTAYILYIFQFISGGKVWYFIIIRISTGYTKLLIHYSITYQLLPCKTFHFFIYQTSVGNWFCLFWVLKFLWSKEFWDQNKFGPTLPSSSSSLLLSSLSLSSSSELLETCIADPYSTNSDWKSIWHWETVVGGGGRGVVVVQSFSCPTQRLSWSLCWGFDWQYSHLIGS